MPDDLSGEMLPRPGGLALVNVHRRVVGVADDEEDVRDVVGDVVCRGRHCAGVTGLWEVTDRDKAMSQRPIGGAPPFPTHGPSLDASHLLRVSSNSVFANMFKVQRELAGRQAVQKPQAYAEAWKN